MILHVSQVEVVGPALHRLRFNDGVRKVVDATPLLEGPVLRPLLRPSYFRRVRLDAKAATVVWPSGADQAPEALHALPAHGRKATSALVRTATRSSRTTSRRGR